MTLYFKIDPGDDSIIEVLSRAEPLTNFNDKTASQVNGKPYLVEVAVTDPAYDPASQVREGPLDAYDGTTATRTYTIRAKTQAELDAEQLAQDVGALQASGKDAVIVITGLIDALLAKGLILATDVDGTARQAYQDLKVVADRVKAQQP
jgi:hypothetical protein